MSESLILIAISLGLLLYLFSRKRAYGQQRDEGSASAVPKRWHMFLMEKVNFYRNLDEEKQQRFCEDISNFLSEVKITGVKTNVTVEDRLLVASSAIIPLFGFPAWNYRHLDEVLLYPDSFDRDFNIGSQKEIITGMVGSGAMEGKVILSKPALHVGFDITNDKKNVGIHEFVHLYDKEDGVIDGVPPGFQDKAYTLPWLDLIKKKTDEVMNMQSDINPYGATNRQEFFAVASEYFFERPHLLKRKHPELYRLLSEVFRQDMVSVLKKTNHTSSEVGRNDHCPCGSGVKYKKCCDI